MAPKLTHSQRLSSDLSQNLASALRSDPTLTPTAAMLQITQSMLANNPFVPPVGCCPINDLPPELLAHIFLVGTMMEVERAGMDEDEEEDGFDLKEGWDTDEEEEEEERRLGDPRFRLRTVSDWKVAKGREVDDDDDDDDDDEDEKEKEKEKQKEKETEKETETKKGKEVSKDDGDMDWEDVDEDGEEFENGEEQALPFQVLVSHVCRHWRDIATNSPSLWTRLDFLEGAPFEKSKTYIERSKGLPLDIYIDCSAPESADHTPYIIQDDGLDQEVDRVVVHTPQDIFPPIPTIELYGHQYVDEHKECDHPPPYFTFPELATILDIITPHVAHWHSLEVSVSYYEYMHLILKRLDACPAAPILEVLELYHRDNNEEAVSFEPVSLITRFLPFSGIAPKLSHAALWGVHLDWDRAVPMLSGMHDLELAYHTEDVRPSYAVFAQIITGSPDLHTLTLSLSGPIEHDENDPQNDWGTEPLAIPSLKELVLCYHASQYAIALVKKLSVPNVTSLTLDFDSEDYSEFARELARPGRDGTNKSLLAGLEHLKISGLPCSIKAVEDMFLQLAGLRTLNLNCSGGTEELFFDVLMETGTVVGGKVFCPNLHTIATTGIEGAKMRRFVELRRGAGVPVRRVLMSEEDDIDAKDEKWIRAHVEELEFFEPSDSEEEFVDLEEDEDDEMDEDQDEMEVDG